MINKFVVFLILSLLAFKFLNDSLVTLILLLVLIYLIASKPLDSFGHYFRGYAQVPKSEIEGFYNNDYASYYGIDYKTGAMNFTKNLLKKFVAKNGTSVLYPNDKPVEGLSHEGHCNSYDCKQIEKGGCKKLLNEPINEVQEDYIQTILNNEYDINGSYADEGPTVKPYESKGNSLNNFKLDPESVEGLSFPVPVTLFDNKKDPYIPRQDSIYNFDIGLYNGESIQNLHQQMGCDGDTALCNRSKYAGMQPQVSIENRASYNKYSFQPYVEEELRDNENRDWWDNIDYLDKEL